MTEAELQAKVLTWVEDAVSGFELPEGEGIESYVKRVTSDLIDKIPKDVNPDDVQPGDSTPQRSETPIVDHVRYTLAQQGKLSQDPKVNRRVIDELNEKDFVVGTTTAGGHLAPSEYSTELIDLVYKDSNVAGYLMRVPMPRGPSVVFPVVSSGTTAYTIAESSDSGSSTATTESTATYTTVTVTAYRHGVYSKVSNELLEDSDPSVEEWIKNDFARQLASYFDWEVFHGTGAAGADGTAGLITGLESAITSNVFTVGGGLSFDNIVDLMTPEDNTPGDLTMFANPAARRELLKVKDSAGQYVYDPKAGGDMGSVWGIPLVKNNRISKTLGAGSETAIFSGAFGSSGFMGVKSGINLIVDPYTHGEYFSTRIIAHIRLGFQVASESHFAVLNGISL